MFRTSNPALSDKAFDESREDFHGGAVMTSQGAVNKSFILVGILVIVAGFAWEMVRTNPAVAMPALIGAAIAGFVLSLVCIFVKKSAPITAPLYAMAQGVVIGSISFMFNQQYAGIVFNAVVLTIGVLAAMLILYKTGIIKVTQKFAMCIAAATGAIMITYLLSFVLSFFGMGFGFIHGSGWFGIGFSVVVVIVAALNLALDFDFIEKGGKMNLPKYMEWYAAFGLLVTLVWLYLEILRLLAKLQRR